jgi:hypothetical protein
MNTITIQATVNPRLLQKASRLFTGTMEGRIIEILQNARRADATEVQITNAENLITVRDNGRGIEEFKKLLDLGSSGWDDAIELSEDPAGVGLFSLAPRELTIRSQGSMLTIRGDGWTGTPVDIENDPIPNEGTELRFPDERWTPEQVSACAVFSGLRVVVDGEECPKLPFISDSAVHHPELGCRIEVCPYEKLNGWYARARREPFDSNNVFVNFHGQVVTFDYHPVGEHSLRYLVDLTGEPTGIRLMLPARTRLVENEAFEALKAALELEAYRFIENRGEHSLVYKEYLRAKELGITLPEAKPTYEIGLLKSDGMPDPVRVEAPKDYPLAQCYRFDSDHKKWEDNDATNIHLLAALGSFETPFVPVDVRSSYNGYSWANMPTVDDVKVIKKKTIHEDWLWSGTLVCVESITITVRTSDGRVFRSGVCMAVLPAKGKLQWADAIVYVTKEARQRLSASEVWYHLGGWNEDGDTFDTQERAFSEDLERFWADVIGPDEYLRQNIVKVLFDLPSKWKRVTITPDGAVDIQLKNGAHKRLQPPPAQNRSSP